LSEALYVIRRELGEGVLHTYGDEVSLSAVAVHSDVGAFREAAEVGDWSAVAGLYAGPFLDGWYVNDAPDLSRWIDEQRMRLSEAYIVALGHLIKRDEQEDRWSDAAMRWRRLAEQDPHRASYAIGLALALAMAGERPAALNALSRYQERLRIDMEVEPDDEVLRLERRLRRDGKLSPRASPGLALPTTDSAQEAAVSDLPAPELPSVPSLHRARWAWVAAVAGCAVAGTLAFALARLQHAPPADLNRLAVLYLRDASVERDLGPTADVITEALIEQLAGVNAFEVIQGGGVKRFRTSGLDVDSVARALHAGSVVDGTVQRADDRLIVSIRLINALTGTVVWSSHFEGGASNLLELQQRIARDVASAIRQRLGVEVRLRELAAGTTNERARQLLARGNRERDDARELLSRTSNGGEVAVAAARLRIADSLYAQAHAEDQRWARPLVERGWTALLLSPLDSGTARSAFLGAAITFADQALTVMPNDPGALELRGTTRWRRYRAMHGSDRDSLDARTAVADLENAVGRDSMLAHAWATLSNIYWINNNPRLSYLAGRHALKADTYLEDSARIIQNLISASLLRDTFDSASSRSALDTARAWCARGRAQFPTNWHFTECALTVMKYDETARPDVKSAMKLLARLDTLDPPAGAAGAGHAYSPIYRRLIVAAVMARDGDMESARAMLAEQKLEAKRLDARTGPDVQLDLIPEEVTLQLLFGDTVRAGTLLSSAIAARPILRGVAANDPLLFRGMRRIR